MQAEFRQRLLDGSYQIRAYGIDQLNPGDFAGQPGDRQFRWGAETKGQFALNDKWVWGWDGIVLSDYILAVGLPARAIQGSDGGVHDAADGGDFRALPDRRRQSQLLRCPRAVLSQPFRPAEHGAGRGTCHRLFQRDQPFGVRRRGLLQDQLHQPDPRNRGVRSDHVGGLHQRPVFAGNFRRPGPDHRARELPAPRHARHLHPRDGRGAMAEIVHRFGRRDLDAVCEHPSRRDRRRHLEPAGGRQLSCRSATPRRCA